MAFSSSGNSAPDINVTPLIDVLLVLLIICMIITPLTPKGLGASIPNPDADQAAPAPETAIVLHIASAGDEQPRLKINQQEVRWDGLGAKLTEIYKKRGDHVMFVQGESDVSFMYVAEAINEARQSGVEKIGLLNETIR